ncbi:hypothetical protein ACLI1A_14670 [Flavobacterium sp. RHBU_3]|uniref:hypothetical protein n=1 Tax=Flavobacterium sp. RHBU_3 TaxID=3391184 RepID=UPI0039855255
MKPHLVFLIFLFFSFTAFAQKNCGFVPDTIKILNDKNVDLFLQRLKTDKFEICTSKKQIPQHITKILKCLNNGEFSISELNGEYQDSDIIEDENIPSRGLIFLAKNENTLIICYGLSSGPGISSKILLIDYDKKGINDLWVGTTAWTRKLETIEGTFSFVTALIKQNKVFKSNYLYF